MSFGFVLGLIAALVVNALIIIPLRKAVIKKYSYSGEVWFDRVFFVALFMILIYANAPSFIIYIVGGLLVFNMVVYNPWALPTILQTKAAIDKMIEQDKDKDRS